MSDGKYGGHTAEEVIELMGMLAAQHEVHSSDEALAIARRGYALLKDQQYRLDELQRKYESVCEEHSDDLDKRLAAESRLDQFCKLAYDISGQQHRDERYWCVWPDQMRKLDDLRREHRGEETARIVETSVTICTCPHEGICEYGPQDPRCGRNDRWFEAETPVHP